MLQRYKQILQRFLNRFHAFEGRSFYFQLLTLAAIAASMAIVANGLYYGFYSKPEGRFPTVFTATALPSK